MTALSQFPKSRSVYVEPEERLLRWVHKHAIPQPKTLPILRMRLCKKVVQANGFTTSEALWLTGSGELRLGSIDGPVIYPLRKKEEQ